jgi:hypothetical protein
MEREGKKREQRGNEGPSVSQELERWLKSPGTKSIGSLLDVFEEKSFAILFVLLMGVPAIPAPTGGATHVFEVITVLLALQLIVGRVEIWLPQRWREKELSGPRQKGFIDRLMRIIRWLEKFSKPRFRFLFNRRPTNIVFGVMITALSVAAFFAPPFSGLDTLPALGAVLISLGVLLEDFAFVIAGLVVGALGVLAEIILGKAAVDAISDLF